MEKEIKEIRKKLKKYFSDIKLEVFDNPVRAYYTGVTLDYIFHYVLKNEHSKELVCYTIIDMLLDEELRCLRCGDVKNLVIECKKSDHWTYSFDHEKNEFYTTCPIFGEKRRGDGLDFRHIKAINSVNLLIKSYIHINTKLQNKPEMSLS